MAVVAAVAGLAAFSPASHAAGTASLSTDKTTLTYNGTSNTSSKLKVSFNGLSYILEEASSAPLTAGPGCTVVTASTKISCPSLELTAIDLNMGDLTDSLTMGSTAHIPVRVLTTVNDVGNVTSSDGPMEIHCTDGPIPGTTAKVEGGSSYDNIFIDGRTPLVLGGAKDDQITLKNSTVFDSHTAGLYWVDGGPGHDLIDGTQSRAAFNYQSSPGTDVVLGGPSHDEFQFGHDRDLIYGNGGDDRFYSVSTSPNYESDLSEIWGGPGDDVLTDFTPITSDVTHYEGGPGTDRVTYANGANYGYSVQVSLDDLDDDGNIAPEGIEGDHIHLSVENIGNYEQMWGGGQMTGNDILTGSDRANEIGGEFGDDYIDGLAGNDHLFGEQGSDTVLGGDGSDLLDSLADGDYLDGGNGDDRVSFAKVTSGSVVIDLHPETASPGPMESIENATGSPSADTITGNDGPNKVDGANGDDTFYMSGGGSDEITCGAGIDTVFRDSTDVVTDEELCESITIE